ncbi:MAG: site-specific integrase [Bacteroidales bacterium]|nr:site-specific integrase [Acholeplasmataceae bacterium]MCK9449948.1 site-specific integrase [Bacteroidales bacterium]
MAIIRDNKRKNFYINYKYKLLNGEWKNINIRNKEWTFSVGIRYMKSIEYDEIEKDKEKRKVAYSGGDTITVTELIEFFYQVRRSENIDNNTLYNYQLAYKNYLFPIISPTLQCEKAFTMHNVDRFRINLTSQGLSSRTINNKLTSVRKLIEFAKKRRFMNRELADEILDILEPIKENRREKNHTNFFINGEEDLRKFIAAFDSEEGSPEWRIPVLTMFYGALRVGEWQAIKRNKVNFDNNTILIDAQVDSFGQYKESTKTGMERTIHLPETFMRELEAYVEERAINQDEFIFLSVSNKHIGRNTVRRVVNRHIEIAGIAHITLHGLRHSFATRMFDKNYDVREVQAHLGHASMNTTMEYYIHHTKRKEKKDLSNLL